MVSEKLICMMFVHDVQMMQYSESMRFGVHNSGELRFDFKW